MADIITAPYPPNVPNAVGVRAKHVPSGLTVICLNYTQEHRNRAEAQSRLETIVKHRALLESRK
jgi:protein subunit release factor A